MKQPENIYSDKDFLSTVTNAILSYAIDQSAQRKEKKSAGDVAQTVQYIFHFRRIQQVDAISLIFRVRRRSNDEKGNSRVHRRYLTVMTMISCGFDDFSIKISS